MDFRSLPHNTFLAGLPWDPSMSVSIGLFVRLVASHDGKVTLSFKNKVVSTVKAQDDLLNVAVSRALTEDATPDQDERWNNYVQATRLKNILQYNCPHAVQGRFSGDKGQHELTHEQADRLYGNGTMRLFDRTCKLFKAETGVDTLWWGDHVDSNQHQFCAMVAPGVEVRLGGGKLNLARWRPPYWVGSSWLWEPTTGPVSWGEIEGALRTLVRSSWDGSGWKVSAPPLTKLEMKWI